MNGDFLLPVTIVGAMGSMKLKLAVTAVLFLASVIRQEESPTPDSTAVPARPLQEQLTQVQRLIEVERWRQAREHLLSALEDHRDEGDLTYRVGEVRRLLKNIAFGMNVPPADPAECVEGALLRYRPERREVRIAYRAKAFDARKEVFEGDFRPGDFLAYEGFDGQTQWVHTLTWNGPYTIRVRGRALPTGDPLYIVACATEDQASVVGFGDDAALMHASRYNDNVEILAERDTIAGTEPYEIEIEVRARDLSVCFNGERILQGQKIRNLYGRLSFSTFDGIEEIRIEGSAEFSWFQRQVDAEMARRRLEFEKVHDVDAELPEWLRARAPNTETAAKESLFHDFGTGEALGEVLGRSEAFFARMEYEQGLAYVDGLAPDAFTAVRAWLRCLFLEALGRYEEALVEARACAANQPEHFKVQRKLVELERQLGTREEGLEHARGLLASFPERPESHEDLIRAVLLAGDLSRARMLLNRAAQRGISSKQLYELDDLLQRAGEGPVWRSAYQYRSRYFQVRSDISRNLCLEAGRTLDTAYQNYARRWGRIEERSGHYPVYIFSGEVGYQLYTRDLFGEIPVHTAGLFTPILQQLLVWNLPRKADVMNTLRHECFHQYLDALVGQAPAWLHEGMAEYFERAENIRGQWTEGQPATEHLALLRSPDFEWPPLEEFLHSGHKEFHADGFGNYARAWLWIHYLERSSVENKQRLKGLIAALRSGTAPPTAVRQAFPASDLERLERGWKAQLDRL